MECRVEPGEKPVIFVEGELDMATADLLRSELERVLAGRPVELVFDLAGLTFVDSSGLAILLIAARQLDAVHLRNASVIVRRVVEAMGLGSVLLVEP